MAKKAILFPLTEKDLRVEYPELNLIEEFKGLTAEEMLFVWNIACPSSPFLKYSEAKRIANSLEPLKKTLTSIQLKQYSAGKYPEHIKRAIERMGRFDVDARIRGKMIVSRAFEDLERIVTDGIPENASAEEKKKHVELISTVVKIIPSVIHQVENGYGIKFEEVKEVVEPTDPENEKPTWEQV